MVAREQPCLIVGDFNVEPPKIPCLAKGISAGLWVDLEAAWALARESQPAVTCERTWDSDGGYRRDFMVGCTLAAAAAVTSCRVELDWRVASHLAVRTYLDCGRWACKVAQPVHIPPLAAAGDWVKKLSYHTAWAVSPLSSCLCSHSYGQGTAVGPHTGGRCWSLPSGTRDEATVC